eukprot:scaffold672047_cov57-Prasinocladus_malaysianus.AAC.2
MKAPHDCTQCGRKSDQLSERYANMTESEPGTYTSETGSDYIRWKSSRNSPECLDNEMLKEMSKHLGQHQYVKRGDYVLQESVPVRTLLQACVTMLALDA